MELCPTAQYSSGNVVKTLNVTIYPLYCSNIKYTFFKVNQLIMELMTIISKVSLICLSLQLLQNKMSLYTRNLIFPICAA